MIKKILFGALLATQFSVVFAANSNENSNLNSNTELYQEKPKSFIIKTKKFKVKVDLQPNGKYLYQSWSANGKVTSKPSMIINNGELNIDAKGNFLYAFMNNEYRYDIFQDRTTLKYHLTVVNDKSNKVVVDENAVVVKN